MEKTGKTYGAVSFVANDPVANPNNVNRRTLATRYQDWINDGKPMVVKRVDARGGHNRLLTVEQERELAIEIQTHFLEMRLPFCNEDFKLFLQQKLWEVHGMPTRSRHGSQGSNGQVWGFKQRWGFKSRRPRISKVLTLIYYSILTLPQVFTLVRSFTSSQ